MDVRETRGLARRGFPVHTLIKLPRAVPVSTKFRLTRMGQPVVAQFRPDGDDATADWWLDFQSDMSPRETKQFQIEYGDDVSEVPELARGHELIQTENGFAITHAPYITWKIPDDLKGFLSSVDFQSLEFLRDDSSGFVIKDRQSKEISVTGKGKVIRQGHMTVALRYETTYNEPSLRDVRSTIDLTLPGPVSWIQVDWLIDDPHEVVESTGLGLHLHLDQVEKLPTLVDFGANSMVYLSLYPGQATEFHARPPEPKTIKLEGPPTWEIIRREPGRTRQFAAESDDSAADGWAHVMDRKRCLALAVQNFGQFTFDDITVTANGDVGIWRKYRDEIKTRYKRARFWLHFVSFPPQASAGTSPQQMQSPLEVRISSK